MHTVSHELEQSIVSHDAGIDGTSSVTQLLVHIKGLPSIKCGQLEVVGIIVKHGTAVQCLGIVIAWSALFSEDVKRLLHRGDGLLLVAVRELIVGQHPQGIGHVITVFSMYKDLESLLFVLNGTGVVAVGCKCRGLF